MPTWFRGYHAPETSPDRPFGQCTKFSSLHSTKPSNAVPSGCGLSNATTCHAQGAVTHTFRFVVWKHHCERLHSHHIINDTTENKPHKQIIFLYDSKRTIRPSRGGTMPNQCSTKVTCQSKFASEPEKNPCVSSVYIGQVTFSVPSVILFWVRPGELLSSHMYPTHTRSVSRDETSHPLELPLQLAVVLSKPTMKF